MRRGRGCCRRCRGSALVDVVAGARAEEAEVEVLAERGEVLEVLLTSQAAASMKTMTAKTWIVSDRYRVS